MSARTALVLVGHGSHISPNTAGLVWSYADRLRQQGAADEVTACFWKEEPSIREVLNTLQADDITVIPVFTAQGYFTQSVIPAELGLDGIITRRDGRIIRYGKTPGEHPDLAGIMKGRVDSVLVAAELNPSETTVALVGHGTKRNTDSRKATRQQVQLLNQMQIAHEVIDGYLDDEPNIPSLYARTTTPNLIVIPFFLAPGSHVSIDVPNALGLSEGHTSANLHGKALFYTDPIGTEETLCEMILDLAYEIGLPKRGNPQVNHIWDGFPQIGQSYLVNRIHSEGEVLIGELRITANSVSPVELSNEPELLQTPADLRSYIRENPFRPLASAYGLPRDWAVRVNDLCEISGIVETIYPGAVAAQAQYAEGRLKVTSLAETLRRQVGDFRVLESLTAEVINKTIETSCGQCIKHPRWHDDSSHLGDKTVPCAEACNFWMSRALENLS